MTLLIFYVALALCVSFLCSLLEASLLTITPSAIRSAEEKGLRWAATLKRLKDDVERPLSAILTLNTVAHTMGAAGAGAQYAALYGAGSEAVFAALLTLAVLVITEIIPKTLGARYAIQLAPFTTRVLPLLILAPAPIVWASRQLTRLITFGKPAAPPRHREELLAVASLGHSSGQIDESEMNFMRNILQLNAVRAEDVMTPRTVVTSLPMDATMAGFVQLAHETPYTRIPVYDEHPDKICGFVIKHEVFAALTDGAREEDNLTGLIRALPGVFDRSRLDKLFHRMITERQHILAIMDEYGTFLGLLTLEDILETIFGFEIVDELDEVPDLQAYARELSERRTRGSQRTKGQTLSPAPVASHAFDDQGTPPS